MDNMENSEKKAKRPRIGVKPTGPSITDSGRYEKIEYKPGQYSGNRYNEYNSGEGVERSNSGTRQYNRDDRGYQNRYQSYDSNGYQPRQNTVSERNEGGEYYPRHQGSYQPRSNSSGYVPRENGERLNTSYPPRQYQEGVYQQRRDYRNDGFRQQQPRNSYQREPNYGGYDRPRYNNNYGPRFQPQYEDNGGFQQRYQGGYRNGGGYTPRQGGFKKPQFGGPAQKRRNNGFVQRPRRIEYEMPIPDINEQIRLNKFMANSGICSRREADEFIQQGLVKVNGKVVTELGTKITHSDTVEYDEKIVALESKCYILLNKPKNCVTTSDDPIGRLTVLDLVKGACNERIYPVGRLDRNTTGVLLLTNDGDLASRLTHPKYVKKKIYHVWCDRDIAEADLQKIADGVELEDGMIHADAISYANETDRNQAGIEIHSGQNRIVRRIFEKLGYHVTKLDRVYFAGLTKKNLPRGRWRYLTQEEVNKLKRGAFE